MQHKFSSWQTHQGSYDSLWQFVKEHFKTGQKTPWIIPSQFFVSLKPKHKLTQSCKIFESYNDFCQAISLFYCYSKHVEWGKCDLLNTTMWLQWSWLLAFAKMLIFHRKCTCVLSSTKRFYIVLSFVADSHIKLEYFFVNNSMIFNLGWKKIIPKKK